MVILCFLVKSLIDNWFFCCYASLCSILDFKYYQVPIAVFWRP